jgi:hypothetical protein
MRFQVIPAMEQPIGSVPGHASVEGIERLLLLTNAMVPGRTFHIAAHYVSGPHRRATGEAQGTGEEWLFTTPHEHPFDEINVVLPVEGKLRYRYEVDGAIEYAEGPCAVLLAAGVAHRMEPVEGRGLFLCIQLNSLP